MALIHCDGFDGQAALVTGALYAFPIGNSTKPVYSTGRLGGSSIGATSTSSSGGFRMQRAVPVATTYVSGFAVKPSDSTNSTAPCWLTVWGLGGVYPLRLVYDRVSAKLGLYNSTTLLQDAPITLNVWHFIEVKATAATTATGSATVKVDGVTTLTVSSVNWGVANWDSMALSTQNVTISSTSTSPDSYAVLYDDWYICNTSGSKNNDFLGDVRVANLLPVGAGSSTQLTPSAGSNWQCVEEAPPSTADYVGGATPGLFDLYAMSDLPAGGTTVLGVQVNAYAAKSDTGAISGRAIAKSGGTTANGSDLALSTSYQMSGTVMENDPSGAAWTPTSLNAAEFGWEVRA